MLRRRSFLLVPLGAVLLAGCGGSGGSDNTATNPGGGIPDFNSFTPHNDYKLSPSLVQLDNTAGFSVVSVSENSVVLQKAPPLTAGQIILHNSLDEKSFCRKVVSSTVSGTTTTVQTTRAYMNDVFASANIFQRKMVSQDDLNKIKSVNPGVTISEATPAARMNVGAGSDSRGEKSGAVTFTFNNVQIYDSSNTKAVATVNGKITLTLGAEYDYVQSGFIPQSFKLAPYFQIDGNLSASVVAAGAFEKEIPIASSPPIPLGALAALGITGDVQLKLKVDGSFNANGNFSATASLKAGGGLQYSRSGGFGIYPIEQHSFSMVGPNFDGAGHLGASLVRPQVGMHLPGIADLTATLDAARATVDVQSSFNTQQNKAGLALRTQGELNATLAGRVGLGPITLWQSTASYQIAKFDIAGATTFVPFPTPSTAGTIAYLAPDTRSLHFINPDGTNDRSILSAPTGATFNSPTITRTGRRLAYYLVGTNASGLYTTAANGASPKKLDLKGLTVNGFSWKPDGTELAVAGPDSKGVNQVYVYTLSTGARRQITNSSLSIRNPSWTPDGRELFVEFSPNPSAAVIASFSSTGTNQNSTTARVNDPSQVLARPVVSPDGKTVLMESAGLGLAVASTNASTSSATDIVRDLPNFFPGWSPDGVAIVAQVVDKGVSRIVTYTKSGSNRKAIINGSNPSWGANN